MSVRFWHKADIHPISIGFVDGALMLVGKDIPSNRNFHLSQVGLFEFSASNSSLFSLRKHHV